MSFVNGDGVLIIIAFIVIAPLLGALFSYLISIWLLHTSRKTIGPKVFTIALMAVTIWGVGSQTETQYLRVFIGTLRKKIESNSNQPQLVMHHC